MLVAKRVTCSGDETRVCTGFLEQEASESAGSSACTSVRPDGGWLLYLCTESAMVEGAKFTSWLTDLTLRTSTHRHHWIRRFQEV